MTLTTIYDNLLKLVICSNHKSNHDKIQIKSGSNHMVSNQIFS